MSSNSPHLSVPEAVDQIRAGKMVIVVDDEDRENEGDLTMAADMVTPEAAIGLARRAGRAPAGVICEIMREDGEMARVSDLEELAALHGLGIVRIADLIQHRLSRELLVHRAAHSTLRARGAGGLRGEY